MTTLGDGVVVGFVEVGGVVVVEESVAAVGEVAELADVVDRVVAGLEAVLSTTTADESDVVGSGAELR